MRILHASLPPAVFGCLLSAPGAFAAGSDFEKAPVNTDAGDATTTAAHSANAGGSIVRTIVGLAVVLGVIYGIHWLLKQVKNSKESTAAGESLETVASLSLGTGRSLHLVRVGGEIVLLGAAEHQITPIRRYSEAEAYSLGLLDTGPMTLASLEAESEQPKGLINILRAKTVAK